MNPFEKYFLPFDLSKLAMEKGFNEPCMAYWEDYKGMRENRLVIRYDSLVHAAGLDRTWIKIMEKAIKDTLFIPSPLLLQIADWLDSKQVAIMLNSGMEAANLEFIRMGLNFLKSVE